tara:strand:+ start:4649 stop:5917 length:1269 start_codon:yes stop_codon:yes gene_type:complete
MNWSEFLVSKGLTQETYEAKIVEEIAVLQKEYSDLATEAIKEAIKGKASKKEVEAMITEATKGLVDFVSKEDYDELKQALVTQGETITAMKNTGNAPEKKVTLSEEIKENKDNIRAIVKGDRSKEVVLKATVSSTSISNNASGYFLPNVGQLDRKDRGLYNVLPKITIPEGQDAGTIRYLDWDNATTVKAAATVAEGGSFAESTATFQYYNISLKKIGDTLPVVEEFGEDNALAAAELNRFLSTNVEDVVDTQLATGNNTGNNLKGLTASATAYTPAASGITDANLKDLGTKMVESVSATLGKKYRYDIAVMNLTTFNTYALKKDSQNRYLFDEETGMIAGLIPVIDASMASNTMIVGDRRYATIYEKAGLVLSEGYTGTDFTDDIKRIKARKRIQLLVRTADAKAFIYSDDVAADIATLAT